MEREAEEEEEEANFEKSSITKVGIGEGGTDGGEVREDGKRIRRGSGGGVPAFDRCQ